VRRLSRVFFGGILAITSLFARSKRVGLFFSSFRRCTAWYEGRIEGRWELPSSLIWSEKRISRYQGLPGQCCSKAILNLHPVILDLVLIRFRSSSGLLVRRYFPPLSQMKNFFSFVDSLLSFNLPVDLLIA
jgi:hypothetical protein